jgi:hypothetical protein
MMREAEALATILQAENAALAALDLTRAAALVAEKQRAAAAFAAARLPADQAGASAVARRLVPLIEENRRLLERGIAVQARVMKVIARAAARAPAAKTAGYSAAGTPRTPLRAPAMAVCARA